ncbi:choline dehydrogenase [Phyllosticta citrichinensis]|uniref:Choline dehydrogenase n=1 Tax=Phyllosticta citrichinensis TaxID=1130410 RepID=A0ABR1XP15_9PEZI
MARRKSLFYFSLLFFGARVSSELASRADSSGYDYIVVGGGTCGLVVASRLSENANVTVLVIEAGESVYDNEHVTSPSGYSTAFGTPIDWNYTTTAQSHAHGKTQTLHQGKAIGGTSTINGMSYTRADAAQIDAWEKIGNAGWNWDNLYPYYRKHESFEIPNQQQENGGSSYVSSFHGFQGPVKVGWPLDQSANALGSTMQSTYEALGIPASEDVNGGDLRGSTAYPKTVDEEANVRHDAARAYFWPHYPSRPNLALASGTTVKRLLWSDSKNGEGNVVAKAVEVVAANGTTSTLEARKGVVVSAGTIRTPQLLELSGVGNPRILSKYNISTRVSLPGVGENLIDQNNNGLTYPITTGQSYNGGAPVAAYPNVTDLFGNSTSTVASSILAALPSYADKLAAQNNNATSSAALLELLRVQHALLFESYVAAAEILHYPNGKTVGSEFWSTLPFSRGNVHIAADDWRTGPQINPNYFMLGYDAQSQAAVARYMRRLYATAPLNGLAGSESWPGTASVPADADDATWTRWLKSNYRSNYHLLSTAAMMPREMGGVVSERLRVYGTANVRVVDASVLPFQVSGHLMSTLYAVAERASDFIKEDEGL